MEITVPLYGLIAIPIIFGLFILLFVKPFKNYRILTGIILWYVGAGIWIRWHYLHGWYLNLTGNSGRSDPIDAVLNWITSPISTPAYWLIYRPICYVVTFIDSFLI